MRIAAVSGSLRSASSNASLLRAVALLAPDDDVVFIDLALPWFNPDLDEDEPPPVIAELRTTLRACDAIVLSSPEYAHGVPGVLKNFLDWLVSDGLLVDKKVALLNASPRSKFAHAQIAETLRTMSWNVVLEADVNLSGRKLDAEGIAADAELASIVRGALQSLRDAQ
ncbi:MAG TPA: NADPH-dependent FMN reductase [Thermoanaerobaculia bacterium]|nr:NADPH-dependent FMN reductase [Thermoanaerobaculia bacterium]